MASRILVNSLLKLPLCGISFFVGMTAGGILLPLLGLDAPAVPEGTDANTIALWFLLASMLLALPLSWVSRRLAGGFVKRWLILTLLTWICSAVNMVLEAFFFMDTGAVSSLESGIYTALNLLAPCVTLSGSAALLFRPNRQDHPNRQTFWSTYRLPDWIWRFAVALLAYPVIYVAFGLLVNPLIADYYVQGAYELAAPTWGQLIPLQLARSALLALACLPVLIAWRGTQRALF